MNGASWLSLIWPGFKQANTVSNPDTSPSEWLPVLDGPSTAMVMPVSAIAMARHGHDSILSRVLVARCQGAIFHFSNFDFWQVKIPTRTHYHMEISSLPLPHCTSTPLRFTHQDEHGQEQRTSSTWLQYSRVDWRQRQQLVLQDISNARNT